MLGRWPGWTVALPLLILVLMINGVAVWGIVSAERHARSAARQELELRTVANARSFEALLATLWGDFIFLARSPPMARFLETREDPDPMVRRWSRLDVEATLLLFLEANPSVERLLLTAEDGGGLLAAGRRQGTPELLPLDEPRPTAESDPWLRGEWALAGDRGRLEAWLEPRVLLAIAAPGAGEDLRLELTAASSPEVEGGTARVEVVDEHWSPSLHGSLVRIEPASLLLQSVESLAGRLRVNVLLNLLVISLTLVLGSLALRQARRAALLEAEKERRARDAEQQARMRELERRLIRSERLASVGRLAAGIAHEINNPLEGMTNHLTLLEEDLGAGDAAAATARVPRVREGLERAAGVVRQVLRFASPGEGSGREDAASGTIADGVDVAAVAAETVAFLTANPAYRAMRIELEAPAGDWRVRGNAVTLGQLFLNLLINACEVQSGSLGEVEVRLERGGGTARVLVADRGPGFAPEALEHLFEPFFSTRGSSGLGLAVCHGIVREHGGDIQVGDRPGGGAVVEVRLPLTKGDP